MIDEEVYQAYLAGMPLVIQADQDRQDRIEKEEEGTVARSSTAPLAQVRRCGSGLSINGRIAVLERRSHAAILW